MLLFDTLGGFALLLLLPLLLLFRRRRSRVVEVFLAAWPLLSRLPAGGRQPPPLLFRLTRKARAVLTAASLLCLALAFNRTHLRLPESIPGDHLLVLDNTWTLTTPLEGRTLLAEVRGQVAGFIRRLPPRDRVALVVTSPRPRLLSVAEPEEAAARLEELGYALSSPPVADLADILTEMARDKEVRSATVVSPRSGSWREVLAKAGGRFLVPPDRKVFQGNAGIVAFDLRPSRDTEGLYDLFFIAEANGIPGGLPAARLRDAAGSEKTFLAGGVGGSSPAVLEGRERVLARDLSLAPGLVTLALPGGDAFPGDDRVEAVLLPPGTVGVRFHGEPHPFLQEALRTHPGFQLVDASRAVGPVVDVFIGQPPEGDFPGPALVLRPSADFAGFRFQRMWEHPGPARFDPSHPATRDVSFLNFTPSRILEFSPPAGFAVLARSGGVPLVTAGTRQGKRLMVWSFDPIGGGIFLDPSFLILLRSSLEWISKAGPPAGPGEGAGDGEDSPNILRPEVTREAAAVTVPDLSALKDSSAAALRVKRIDLDRFCLGAAFLLLVWLGLASVYPPEEKV